VPKPNQSIIFRMAADGTHYQGTVMRICMEEMDGLTITRSETTTGLSLRQFKDRYPNVNVEGVHQGSMAETVAHMTDEELEAIGLTRMEGFEQAVPEEKEPEKLEPTYTYPRHVGAGTFECSDGTRFKASEGGADAAEEYENELTEE